MKFPTLYKLDSVGQIRSWTLTRHTDHITITHGTLDGAQTTTTVTLPRTSDLETEARSRWNRQHERRGYTTHIPDAPPQLPMLAQVYTDHGHKLPDQVYFQPKLDGIRCIASTSGLYSRRNLPISSCPHILTSLPPGVKLDGELYIHGMHFQNLQSMIRSEANCPSIQYHVYDIITEDPYNIRYKLLQEALKDVPPFIRLVETHYGDKRELPYFTKRFITERYEGCILRDPGGVYEINKRSNFLQKHKLWEYDHFEIIDLIPDRQNRALFVCQVTDNHRVSEEERIASPRPLKTFVCTPALPHGVRASMLESRKAVGQWALVKFKDWTQDGVPREPIGETYGPPPKTFPQETPGSTGDGQ